MADKRKDITQEICNQVQFLIKGGASNKKAGAFVGLSATTISRIRTAGYSAEEFRKNNEARRGYKLPVHHGGTFHKWVYTDEGMKCIEVSAEELVKNDLQEEKKDEQVPGQMEMDLPTEKDRKMVTVEVRVPQDEPLVIMNEQKLIRYLAGKTDLLGAQLSKYDRYMREMGTVLCGIGTKLDKLNDNLCQILRRMDK